ncbi:MAG: Smr/MutS family protein [Alphaproteobacteria bacterium]|nr:Smr/MutS family protein [Alphaproteobacteria bacterium]
MLKNKIILFLSILSLSSINPLYSMEEPEEFPSRFAHENNFIRATCRLQSETGGIETDLTAYMNYFDKCFSQAKVGNTTAAIHLSLFYRGLHFNDTEASVRAWNIAKKFAHLAALGGQPDEYIFLTSVDYGAGKDMKEHTHWSVKQFIDHPNGKLIALTNYLDPNYLDESSRTALRKFVARSYDKGEIRTSMANMYLRGFFGRSEKQKARAFPIAYNEWHLVRDKGVKAASAAFVLYDFVANWFGNSKEFHILASASNFVPMTPQFNPEEFIRNRTRILEYYKIIPEFLQREIATGKNHLRVDLHGLSPEESIECVMELIKVLALAQFKRKSALVITGRGNHSRGNQPVLKPAIQDLLEKASKSGTFSLNYKEDQGAGAFKIRRVRANIIPRSL